MGVRILPMDVDSRTDFKIKKTLVYLKHNNIIAKRMPKDTLLRMVEECEKNNFIMVIIGKKNTGIMTKQGTYQELSVLHNLAEEIRKRERSMGLNMYDDS